MSAEAGVARGALKRRAPSRCGWEPFGVGGAGVCAVRRRWTGGSCRVPARCGWSRSSPRPCRGAAREASGGASAGWGSWAGFVRRKAERPPRGPLWVLEAGAWRVSGAARRLRRRAEFRPDRLARHVGRAQHAPVQAQALDDEHAVAPGRPARWGVRGDGWPVPRSVTSRRITLRSQVMVSRSGPSACRHALVTSSDTTSRTSSAAARRSAVAAGSQPQSYSACRVKSRASGTTPLWSSKLSRRACASPDGPGGGAGSAIGVATPPSGASAAGAAPRTSRKRRWAPDRGRPASRAGWCSSALHLTVSPVHHATLPALGRSRADGPNGSRHPPDHRVRDVLDVSCPSRRTEHPVFARKNAPSVPRRRRVRHEHPAGPARPRHAESSARAASSVS